MKLEIGFFPNYFYSKDPDAGGLFPFGMEEIPSYVFSMGNFYLPKCNENFVPNLMENIQAFPIYFCAEFSNFWKKEYEKQCQKSDVKFKYLYQEGNRLISVAAVENMSQFKAIFPLYISMGSSNDIVMWSTNKDIYSVEERVWKGNLEGKRAIVPVVKLDKKVSLFWIGYDGDSIIGLSNNDAFSTYENICESLPYFVKPALCEIYNKYEDSDED